MLGKSYTSVAKNLSYVLNIIKLSFPKKEIISRKTHQQRN